MKRHYKTNRAKARDPYEVYQDWYKKYTKGNKAGWFSPMYDKDTFKKQYDLAKLAKKKNPARAVAQSQEYVDRTFEKQYKKLYGKAMPDLRNKQDREDLFNNYVSDMMDQGYTYDQARTEYEKYFY